MIRPLLFPIALGMMTAQCAIALPAHAEDANTLGLAAKTAEIQLRQTFTNLSFEDFGPSPISGPIFQATAGGRMIYFAPESGHILFASVYDRNGVNITALAQSDRARKQLAAIDRAQALAIGPEQAPEVIEFTDPDCPYCRTLDRFWATKAVEGKPVRRLIYFVSGIHPGAAAKAEHILCSPDPARAFRTTYDGASPQKFMTCAAGKAKVEADADLVRRIGVSGTPTVIVNGKIISGFQEAELQAFLDSREQPATAGP